LNRLLAWLETPIRSTSLIVLVALYLVVAMNHAFWASVAASIPGDPGAQGLLLLASLAMILSAALVILLSLLCAGPLLKPVLIAVLLIAALSGYFMDAFGTVIDEAMIVNSMQTDVHEVGDLLSLPMLVHLLIFGLLPASAVAVSKRVEQPWRKALVQRCILFFVALTVLVGGIFVNYKQLSLWARPNKQVRLYINPSYPIYSSFLYARDSLSTRKMVHLMSVGADASRTPNSGKPLVVVVVVGETARAANFSLLGYTRDTNPELAAIPGLVPYTQVMSCGTSTAISVPCMFSALGRDGFSRDKARDQENLLDVVKRTGVKLLWRDNNSGCKGVCARVPTEELFRQSDPAFCNSEECLDEILLSGLDAKLAPGGNDSLIVMHQKGSHGPAYFKRYPPDYRRFTPECAREDVQACSREQITNSYDNTIAYTDHVLASLIAKLQAKADVLDSVVLYVSDHGESLGENGLYLHGLPYSLAPLEQKHVPMLLWFSDGAQRSQHVDLPCLVAARDQPASHDNLFDTVLGLFAIHTDRYRADHDLIARCRH
jgi:lipid A ethanolaminephosphotransferase